MQFNDPTEDATFGTLSWHLASKN